MFEHNKTVTYHHVLIQGVVEYSRIPRVCLYILGVLRSTWGLPLRLEGHAERRAFRERAVWTLLCVRVSVSVGSLYKTATYHHVLIQGVVKDSRIPGGCVYCES